MASQPPSEPPPDQGGMNAGGQPPGGYPPPGQPPGGYPPGGYPPGGYPPTGGGPPGGWSPPGPAPSYSHSGGRIDIGQALRYSWAKFSQNAGPLILCTVIVFAVQLATGLLPAAVDNGAGQAIIQIAGAIVGLIMTRGLIRAGLSVVNGHRVDAGQVFRFDRIGGFVVASIILGLGQGLAYLVAFLVFGPVLGTILAVVAVAVVNTLFGFYGFPIVEQDLDGVSGLKRSFELTRPRFFNVFAFWLVMGLVTIAGFLACLVGLLVAIPITYVAQAHAYRQLSGAPVAP